MPRRPLPDSKKREEQREAHAATKVARALLAIALILLLVYLFV